MSSRMLINAYVIVTRAFKMLIPSTWLCKKWGGKEGGEKSLLEKRESFLLTLAPKHSKKPTVRLTQLIMFHICRYCISKKLKALWLFNGATWIQILSLNSCGPCIKQSWSVVRFPWKNQGKWHQQNHTDDDRVCWRKNYFCTGVHIAICIVS